MNQSQKKYAAERVTKIEGQVLSRIPVPKMVTRKDVILKLAEDGELLVRSNADIVEALVTALSNRSGSEYIGVTEVFDVCNDEINGILTKCNKNYTKEQDAYQAKRLKVFCLAQTLRDEIMLGADGAEVLKKLVAFENTKV